MAVITEESIRYFVRDIEEEKVKAIKETVFIVGSMQIDIDNIQRLM